MEWKSIVNLVQTVINAIQNTAKFVVVDIRRISKQTFSVKVTNPQDKVEVSGSVKVSNQPDLEKKIKDIALAIRELKKPLAALKKVDINNFPKPQPFPKFPEFPKEFRVTNPQTEVTIKNMQQFVNAVDKIVTQISELDLKPVVKVEAPVVNVPEQKAPVVNVPAPVVNVEKPDLSDIHEIIEFLEEIGPKKPLAVRLSDGGKFYKALEKMAEIYAGQEVSVFQSVDGGSGRAMLNARNELKTTISDTWDANDVERVSSSLTYFGEETADAAWRVRKVTKDGTITSIRHATARNNPDVASYEDAWTARVDLEYGYAREAL